MRRTCVRTVRLRVLGEQSPTLEEQSPLRDDQSPFDQSPSDALRAVQGVLTAVPLGIVFWVAVAYALFTG